MLVHFVTWCIICLAFFGFYFFFFLPYPKNKNPLFFSFIFMLSLQSMKNGKKFIDLKFV